MLCGTFAGTFTMMNVRSTPWLNRFRLPVEAGVPGVVAQKRLGALALALGRARVRLNQAHAGQRPLVHGADVVRLAARLAKHARGGVVGQAEMADAGEAHGALGRGRAVLVGLFDGKVIRLAHVLGGFEAFVRLGREAHRLRRPRGGRKDGHGRQRRGLRTHERSQSRGGTRGHLPMPVVFGALVIHACVGGFSFPASFLKGFVQLGQK